MLIASVRDRASKKKPTVEQICRIVEQALKMPARQHVEMVQRPLGSLNRIYRGCITMEEVSPFDLHAAFLRRAQSDIKSFLEAFATMMEQSLPGQVEVRRKKDSLFGKTQHVVGITIHLGANRFVLENAGKGLHLSRCSEVRGVVLKSEELPLPDWLAGLNKELGAFSAGMDDAQASLHKFLMS